MLFIISLRNLLELSTSIPTSSPATSASSTGTSFLPTPTLLLTTFSPALTVLISECFVDWLKHAFITKFNHIRPKVYGRYMDVLCKDLIKGQAGNTSSNVCTFFPLVLNASSILSEKNENMNNSLSINHLQSRED